MLQALLLWLDQLRLLGYDNIRLVDIGFLTILL
jgi:hypothetical protein